jgi:hypothetical protein
VRKNLSVTTRGINGYSPGHISNVENGYVTPSLELVEMYVKMGGERSHLRALYELMRQESSRTRSERRHKERPGRLTPSAPPKSLEEIKSPEDVNTHYVIEMLDCKYTFNGDGIVQEVRYVNTIRALSPGVQFFYLTNLYQADQRRGVLRAEAGAGCEVADSQESENGAIRTFFKLDKVLSPDDEAYAISNRIVVDSAIRTRPMLLHHGGSRDLAYILRAQFNAPSVPSKIWWFVETDSLDAQYNLQPEREFAVDADGYYSRSFGRLSKGLSYGFCWLW